MDSILLKREHNINQNKIKYFIIFRLIVHGYSLIISDPNLFSPKAEGKAGTYTND